VEQHFVHQEIGKKASRWRKIEQENNTFWNPLQGTPSVHQ